MKIRKLFASGEHFVKYFARKKQKNPAAEAISAARSFLLNYLRTNRMPSVLGPQWAEMVQPARVMRISSNC